jgi:transcriptional regulator with XRE-family HTH domain
MKMSKDFGQLLKKSRQKKGLTMKQLLDQLLPKLPQEVEYGESAVSKWEHGTRIPPENVVGALEEIFDLPPGNLLEAAGYHTAAAYRRVKAQPGSVVEIPLDDSAKRHGPTVVRIIHDTSKKQFFALVQEAGNERKVPVVYDPEGHRWKMASQK